MVSGEPLDRIRAGNTERNLAGVPDSREFRSHGAYQGAHRERQIEIAKQLFAVMGIERHDKAARQDWVLRGFLQFDAPVSVVLTYDRSIHGGDIAPIDCGGIGGAGCSRCIERKSRTGVRRTSKGKHVPANANCSATPHNDVEVRPGADWG